MKTPIWQKSILVAVVLAVAGCGGGGDSGPRRSTPPVSNPPPAAPPPITLAALNDASRFGARGSFGLDYAQIEALARSSKEVWLDDQFAIAPTLHQPLVNNLVIRRNAGEFSAVEQDVELLIQFRRYAWWHNSVTAPDLLRQRVAYALSQIFVVSDNVDMLIINPVALSNYYDLLLTNAFGNYRDLLRGVTLHPAMGIYLSHVNNRRSDPINNTFPDENYAREVMQLFSIGLYELNVDGSRKLDGAGRPIATYGNDEIREFAKIFTGLSFGGPLAFFGRQLPYFEAPMQMFDLAHEPGEKRLLNGVVVPAGQAGDGDIETAIDNLFNHPNVGPFIGRQLIQRLVTSNPSPAYIERVARAFNGDTTGVRGDMQAVISAVLLDPEATADPLPNDAGKLREPVLRYLAMIRKLEPRSTDGFFFNGGFFLQQLVSQHPLSSPSVFNFYLPDHTPAGEIAAAGLVAPEFQITTTTTVVGVTNLVDIVVNADIVMDAQPPFGAVSLDYSELTALAGDVDALLDRLDVLFTYGTLDAASRAAIRGVLVDIPDLGFRARTAVYLVLVSPDYAVQV